MESQGQVAPRRAVTRADVARLAGVSGAVVSYVVNQGPKKVSPETEQKVRHAIDLLGYRPNLSARALRRGSTEMLALVVPDTSNPFFAEYGLAIEVEATRRGHALVIANTNGDAVTEVGLVADLTQRQVDGLLLATSRPHGAFDLSRPPAVPTVLLNSDEPVAGYRTLGPDFLGGAQAAVDHLVQTHGHSSVALVLGEDAEFASNSRQHGWQLALDGAGLPPGPVLRTEFSRRGGYDAGLRLLALTPRPRAVFVSSDLQAVGLLRAAREAGLDVPADLALVSFDGSAESEYSWPPLTVARQPVRAMAAAAVELLLDPDAGNRHRLFAVELVVRRSCGCPLTPKTV